ncbi:hypothetical protein C2S53_004070 [Perilla frutescens var. hirtella]|uniref:BED-type domain-containing protein n=1 Tax=Perilla frutescens var. hirtella TaxID=608512 RepID=A0AAD4IZH0_PERFH|nr:hypothetical protein C2S53_004070 [Perilla frutescens var. hirtella]
MDPPSTASASDSTTVELTLKRKSNDIGWTYCNLVDPSNLDKVQCIKCGKKMSGGIYRLKVHIAGIKGNVASCTKASKEERELCKNAINEAKLKKKQKKDEDKELRSGVNVNNDGREDTIDVDQLQESFGSMKSPRNLGPMDKFASQISPEITLNSEKSKLRDQSINDVLFKQRTDAAKEYIYRWAYDAAVSFHSLELDSFKMMLEAKEVDRTKSLLKSHEEEWKSKGCSIMTDGWSDRKRRSIMNLCINSRLGTIFLSSKEFSDVSHTSKVIFEYVDQCIEEVGPDNVVQIVTDNASNNMGAAKLLKEKRPTIFWTLCGAHTIDLMLESIAKQERFKKVIDQAKSITIFLYAHHQVLSMMRAFTKKKDIVRPGVTRFASAFLTLQILNDSRTELKAMFGSPEWELCKYSKSKKGKDVYGIVMSLGFWSGVGLCLQVFTPLIKVLQIADGDTKPSMGFLYGELIQAKEDIKISLSNLPKNYEPIIEVIDGRMKGRLDSSLHLTAYLLNPFYHYNNSLIQLDKDVVLGIMDCIDVIYPGDISVQDKILNEEFPIYREKKLIFGKPLAVKACAFNDAKFDLVSWWLTFGIITPTLQRLAVRILSLTTSSSGCERNGSAFEGVHTKKRNRLGTKLVNNLVFVHFNTRLLNKQKKEKDKSGPSNAIHLDMLMSNDSSHVQGRVVDGVDDDVEDGDCETIRDLFDDDFESEEDEEIDLVNEVGDEYDGLKRTMIMLKLPNGDASSCSVYIASGSRIYKLRIAMEDSVVGQGKENLLIPERTQVLESSLVDRCPHRSEIQSIVLAETKSMDCSILGSVDSHGDLIVSRLDASDTDADRSTYSVSPQDCGVGEGSWAGLCFNPSQLSMAAVARSFCKSIDIYDQDINLRTLRTLWYPTSLIFMDSLSESGSSMLATTEGSQLSIWDLRVKENGGCVRRIMGSVGDMLYAVSISSSGDIAVGGEDRTVTVYDPRRWCATSRWMNCSKYEITGLSFSSVDPNYIYVQGVDYEIKWRKVLDWRPVVGKPYKRPSDSVPIGIFWVDGAIRAAYSLLTSLRRNETFVEDRVCSDMAEKHLCVVCRVVVL